MITKHISLIFVGWYSMQGRQQARRTQFTGYFFIVKRRVMLSKQHHHERTCSLLLFSYYCLHDANENIRDERKRLQLDTWKLYSYQKIVLLFVCCWVCLKRFSWESINLNECYEFFCVLFRFMTFVITLILMFIFLYFVFPYATLLTSSA